jgi:zinc/manganese transport system ATP-binding protein
MVGVSPGAAIRVEHLTVAYDRHPAVHHLTGEFPAGSLTAVIGPNGAGKSTLLKAIVGLAPLAEGHIDRGGLSRRDIAYLPQQAELDRRFPISVLDTVLMGAWRSAGVFAAIRGKTRERAHTALSAVGLEGFERRGVDTLSAGQFQRVLFARMMLQDAPVILLDEPFTAIDTKTCNDLLEIVRRWHGEQRTVVAVLHDHEQVREHFPRALLVAREAIAWGPTGEVLSPQNLLAARRMSEAWDDDAAVCHVPDAAA